MSKKSEIKLVIMFTFIFIVTIGCELFPLLSIDKKGKNGEDEERYLPFPYQLYNVDGTEFKGNGKLYLYCDNGEDAREFFMYDVNDGKYGYGERYIEKKTGIIVFPSGIRDSTDFFMSWIDNPPSFSVIPKDYTSSDISVKITDVDNKVNCSAKQGSFYGYRFYDDDNSDEYKLVENTGEAKYENGNITRIFYTDFCFIYPEEGYRIIKGELNYTQTLTDLHTDKKEIADVKITYDMDFGYFGQDRKNTSPFYYIYKKAIYTILEEDPNNIHYKADITIGFRENMSEEDRQLSSRSKTLVDKSFRMRK